MKQLFNNVILNITEIIKLREQEILLLNKLGKHQETTALNFKIKNYNIWIKLLNKSIINNVEIKNKDDIINLKFNKSLENKIIELYESGHINDIENIKNNILLLETELHKHNENKYQSLFSSITSIDSIESTESIDKTDNPDINIHIKNVSLDTPKSNNAKIVIDKDKKIKTKSPKSPKAILNINKDTGKDNDNDNDIEQNKGNSINTIMKLDTTKIESQPKILSEEERPTDIRGAAIYDIRYLYGVGPKNAEKLVDSGITLEKLLEDWTEWIKKNNDNALLMISKMRIPPGYSVQYWHNLSEEKHRTIQLTILHEKLTKETKYLHMLNNHQLLGVKYFHDMSQKIPREEVQKAEHILTATAIHMNKDIKLSICGSYRRGKAKSGDIDCLITHNDIKTSDDLENSSVNILASFVLLLSNMNFLLDHLTDYGKTKYMGFCIIKQPGKKTPTARRIDIRFIPYNSYGTSLLYFTGSKKFNTQMRTHALNKGYSLNEYGLKRLTDNVIISCKTEEEVFTILDYPYKTPTERDIV